ncbi:MAG TPA: cytochrome b [Arenicellales bacterium]|nr:cytochrome b [Arenicellales bacterium]
MQIANSTHRYGAVAMLLHWAIVVLVIIQFVLAFQAAGLETSLERLQVMARHKSFGMTIFMLMILRLGWRFASPPPPLPESMAPWEKTLARVSHRLLYTLLLAMPVAGWVTSNARDLSVSWFGIFTWPDLVAGSERLAEIAGTIHGAFAWLLLAVLTLHVAGALRHHFLKKDAVLLRMLPVTQTRIKEADRR